MKSRRSQIKKEWRSMTKKLAVLIALAAIKGKIKLEVIDNAKN